MIRAWGIDLLFAALLALPAASFAAPVIGPAPYAIEHKTFDCKRFRASLKDVRSFGFSFLWNTFGKNRECLNSLVQDARLELLEIQLAQESCVWFHRCGRYEAFYGETSASIERKFRTKNLAFLRKFRRYLTGARKWLDKNVPLSVQCLVNGVMETRSTAKAGAVQVAETRAIFGDRCLIGWNPVYARNLNAKVGQDFTEAHGIDWPVKAPCVVMNDGVDIRPVQPGFSFDGSISIRQAREFITRHSHCLAVFVWVHPFNCLNPGRFTDPRARNCIDRGRAKMVGDLLESAQQ